MLSAQFQFAKTASVVIAITALAGCFDFDSLKSKPADGGGTDAGDDAAVMDLTFLPRYWVEDAAETLTVGTGLVTVPGGKVWVVFTGEGDAEPTVRAYDAIPGDGQLPALDPDQLVSGLDLEVVSLSGGIRAAVLRAGRFVLAEDATVYAVGERPLVIAATGSMLIAGDLNVGSFPFRGPGGALAVGAGSQKTCAEPPTGDAGDVGAGGAYAFGGGGGAYSGRAGWGGGDTNSEMEPQAGIPIAALPATLQGGCSGGAGGAADGEPVTEFLGLGGRGGGAVQLISLGSLTISGRVSSGGAGGRKNVGRNGGGGGGSGGLVVIESPELTITGAVGAPGGGGGQGGPCGACDDPADTEDGASGLAGANAGGAPGGAAGTGVGRGGAGSNPMAVATSGADVSGNEGAYVGAGGGGGGAGFVILRTTEARTLADFVQAAFDPVVTNVTAKYPFALPVFESLDPLP
jgi:hypothetical protein